MSDRSTLRRSRYRRRSMCLEQVSDVAMRTEEWRTDARLNNPLHTPRVGICTRMPITGRGPEEMRMTIGRFRPVPIRSRDERRDWWKRLQGGRWCEEGITHDHEEGSECPSAHYFQNQAKRPHCVAVTPPTTIPWYALVFDQVPAVAPVEHKSTKDWLTLCHENVPGSRLTGLLACTPFPFSTALTTHPRCASASVCSAVCATSGAGSRALPTRRSVGRGASRSGNGEAAA